VTSEADSLYVDWLNVSDTTVFKLNDFRLGLSRGSQVAFQQGPYPFTRRVTLIAQLVTCPPNSHARRTCLLGNLRRKKLTHIDRRLWTFLQALLQSTHESLFEWSHSCLASLGPSRMIYLITPAPKNATGKQTRNHDKADEVTYPL
jgi:hypothetical protein